MVDEFHGALVPVTEPDFSCSDSLFGGELALKKAKLDPAGEFVKYCQLSRAWPIQAEVSMSWPSGRNLPLSV
jgi:hypothetical protein